MDGCCERTLFNISTVGNHMFGDFFLPSTQEPTSMSSPTATVALNAPPGQTPTKQESAGQTAPTPSAPLGQTSAKPYTTGQTAPTSSAQPTNAPSSSRSVEIGAGVGVPLGIACLSGLIYIIWRRLGKRRDNQPEAERERTVSNHEARPNRRRTEHYEMSSRAAPQELEYDGYWPEELNSNQVHEAAEAF